ncbi:MAG: site-2 protease family protein [Armatimonadota bacterium]|nr:site-2 protease family protein [Armatimonadota bacterium]MDR7450356.1 site-2 protease family protein [Armatimonadota bacterium]MDR7467061.1 site-2 protease family protein [Armatimonadota bacterium]MDR7493397.1 site-2 protease family protein [Armatimonadota bacterium]MDR7499405.1 site-2 protease family protein [Armatimonadota bacterium]
MRPLGLADLLPVLVALVVAATVHEFAHAFVADRLGDPTPRSRGRLTLNPLAHLDPVGSLMILLFRFGWAKPVEINPARFRDPRRGTILVAVAGPLANVTLLFVLGVPYKAGLMDPGGTVFDPFLLTTIWINAMLAVFNLIPVPPLDGSKIVLGLLPPAWAARYARLHPLGVLVLLALVLTNAVAGVVLVPMRWLMAQATGGGIF